MKLKQKGIIILSLIVAISLSINAVFAEWPTIPYSNPQDRRDRVIQYIFEEHAPTIPGPDNWRLTYVSSKWMIFKDDLGYTAKIGLYESNHHAYVYYDGDGGDMRWHGMVFRYHSNIIEYSYSFYPAPLRSLTFKVYDHLGSLFVGNFNDGDYMQATLWMPIPNFRGQLIPSSRGVGSGEYVVSWTKYDFDNIKIYEGFEYKLTWSVEVGGKLVSEGLWYFTPHDGDPLTIVKTINLPESLDEPKVTYKMSNILTCSFIPFTTGVTSRGIDLPESDEPYYATVIVDPNGDKLEKLIYVTPGKTDLVINLDLKYKNAEITLITPFSVETFTN